MPKPSISLYPTKKLARIALHVKRETGKCTIRELARRLEINPKYLHDYLKKGIEPTDKTEHGQSLRIKLGLAKHKHRDRSNKPKKIKPDFIIEWNHIPTEERHIAIKQYLKWRKNK